MLYEKKLYMHNRQKALNIFLAENGWKPEHRSALADDASFRRYDRLLDGDRRVVLMDAPPHQEDTCPFISIAELLVSLGLSAPEIYAQNTDQGFLLLEDFGDQTYTRVLKASPTQEQSLYKQAIDALIHLHKIPAKDQIPGGLAAYNTQILLGEVRLLTDWYIPYVTAERLAPEAMVAYDVVWEELFDYVQSQPKCLVLRDFHVDNLLLLEGKSGVKACGLLDFQDALAGARAYDLMSLLEDARRDIDDKIVAGLKQHYYDAFEDLATPGSGRDAFDATYAILGAGRHAKVIGIFVRLYVRDGKPNYLIHIPRVWRLLERSFRHPMLSPVLDWFNTYVPKNLRKLPSIHRLGDT
jgi:aminoglycoside/choline kinase family phosphotransferase